MNEFRTIAGAGESLIIDKKSKFKGLATPISTESMTSAILDTVRKKHYGASHHVYAYRIGTEILKYSDDGEPSGSAGLPVLETLRGSELSVVNLIVIVTRYFGGVLLGTGGLARCYSQAAKQAVLNAGIITKTKYQEIEITTSYPLKGKLEYMFKREGHTIKDIQYGERVAIRLLVKGGAEKGLESAINDITGAAAEIMYHSEVWL